MTIAQGQIRIRPGTRKNIKAFVQWTRDELRFGRDQNKSSFPIELVGDLICRYRTHTTFLNDSNTMLEPAKPDKFKETTKWEDWKPTFLNCLRSMPRCNGIPLKYVCREKDEADRETAKKDFLAGQLHCICTQHRQFVCH